MSAARCYLRAYYERLTDAAAMPQLNIAATAPVPLPSASFLFFDEACARAIYDGAQAQADDISLSAPLLVIFAFLSCRFRYNWF